MELRSLRYFVVTAEELNITRAAKRLNITQPPLSNQLKALEEELGTVLFIRGKRRLTLTEEGEILLRRANQILELADKTSQELSAMHYGLSGTISVAMVEGRAPFLTARWINGFREEYPKVRYNLWNGSSDEALERLKDGLADVAVVAAPFDGVELNSINVGWEPWVAIMSCSNPLALIEKKELSLQELSKHPLIVPSRKSRIRAILDWFAEVGCEPEILCEMSNHVDAVALAELDVGICIFPQTTYTPNPLIVTKIIAPHSRRVEYYLVWSKRSKPTELTQAYIDFVSDYIENGKMKAASFSVPDWDDVLKEAGVKPKNTL